MSTERRQGSLLLDLERPWRRTWLKPHLGVYDLAISPDGKWAATAGWEGGAGHEQVKVWDTATGLISKVVPGLSCVAFSPDGQWLGIDDRTSYRFFRIGSWAPVSKVDYEVDKTPSQGTHANRVSPGRQHRRGAGRRPNDRVARRRAKRA